ncbi:MAG TPA: hypothetical protein VFN68_02355, partial [Acidimicrobiales bacterium]|nr:hypothetical protein [Acidimicrobiales bacterium]
TLWAWAVLWVGDASLRLVPGQAGLATSISGNAAGAPGWLATIDSHAAAGIHQAGGPAVVILCTVEVLVGLLPLTGRVGRIAGIGLSLPLLASMWVVGQSLGQLYSGQATDPNTAVPLVVLALGVLSAGTATSGRRQGTERRVQRRHESAVAADRLAA